MFPIESRLYEDVKPATTQRGAGNETRSSEFDDSNETLFPMVSHHAASNLLYAIPKGLLAHNCSLVCINFVQCSHMLHSASVTSSMVLTALLVGLHGLL
jgi:hypothetical protein